MDNKYKVELDDGEAIEITQKDLEQLDVIQHGSSNFHILSNNKGYDIKLLSVDLATKTVSLNVDGKHVSCKINDDLDMLIQQMGLTKDVVQVVKSISAPMPGKVLEILIKEGESISQGDSLLILEAMKMENVIKSPGEGIIKNIKVKVGEAVDKGQEMISL